MSQVTKAYKEFPKEYRAWKSLRNRALAPSGEAKYKIYRAKNISVCFRWIISFEFFLEDMGLAPSLLHSLDRIDNAGDYSKDNCRWALPVVQRNNQDRSQALYVLVKQKDGWVVRHKVDGKLKYLKWFNNKVAAENFLLHKKGLA